MRGRPDGERPVAPRSLRLDGRVALVTGGAAGIGRACARAYAGAGADVIVVDRHQDAGQRTVDGIREAGATASFVLADCSDPAQVDHLIKQTIATAGRIDVLHNNHVWSQPGRIGDLSYDGWRRSLDVGLTSYWYATKLTLAHMVEQAGGSIVNTASVSGLAGDVGLGAYNALKAGVISLTRTTAIEYASHDIRCNCVCPGPILTEAMMAIERGAPESRDAILSAVPMGRYGTSDEVASLALFLASDEASFITGAAVVIDGGLSARSGLPVLMGADAGGEDRSPI